MRRTSSWLSKMTYPQKGPAPTTCCDEISENSDLLLWIAYPVGKNITPLGVNDEAGSLAGQGRVGVEGSSLAEVDGDDILDDLFNGALPLDRVAGCADVGDGAHVIGIVVQLHAVGLTAVGAVHGWLILAGLGLGVSAGSALFHGAVVGGRRRLLALAAGVVGLAVHVGGEDAVERRMEVRLEAQGASRKGDRGSEGFGGLAGAVGEGLSRGKQKRARRTATQQERPGQARERSVRAN